MCLPTAAIPAATLAISAVSTVAGIAGTVASIQQANAQAEAQLQQQQQATTRDRQSAIARHIGEVRAQQAGVKSFDKTVANINQGLNRSYVQQQIKEKEAETKAALKGQELLAKSIASQGSVLATGATGQSIGLMAMDIDRQRGFGIAEQDASIDSAQTASAAQNDMAFSQASSQLNNATSQLSAPVQAPLLAGSPGGSLGIPEYKWS